MHFVAIEQARKKLIEGLKEERKQPGKKASQVEWWSREVEAPTSRYDADISQSRLHNTLILC